MRFRGRNQDVGLSTGRQSHLARAAKAAAGENPPESGFLVYSSVIFAAVKEKGTEGKARLSHRIHTRLSPQKYEELTALLASCRGIKSLSELVRNILEEQPIVVKTYDAGLDKVVEELAAIRREVLAIGRNISKVTARLHREQLPAANVAAVLELAVLQQQADQRITVLFELMAKISEQWLPK